MHPVTLLASRELVFKTDIEPAGMDDCIVG